MRSIEPGISRFRVWSFGPSRNDAVKWEERVQKMTGAETLDVARDAIWTIVVVSSPLMIVGLVVGVVVSLFQALTQIQEQTLVFVPKILAIFITLLLALPFMADALHSHMMRISSRIIGG
jgi:flagellar biosynthetic protein FliQ